MSKSVRIIVKRNRKYIVKETKKNVITDDEKLKGFALVEPNSPISKTAQPTKNFKKFKNNIEFKADRVIWV